MGMLKHKNCFFSFIYLPLFLGLFSCDSNPFFNKRQNFVKNPSLTILSWNLQNLFDWQEDGFKYPEFQKKSYVWNKKTVYNRLESITKFFQELPTYPDIVVFQEIESTEIIDLLFSRFFKKTPYSFVIGSPDKKIQVIILSRVNFIEVEFLSLEGLPDANKREFIKVVFPWQNEIISLVGVHLKSWVGTPKRNRYIRQQELTSLGEWLEEDYKKGRTVIIIGDLNQSQDTHILEGPKGFLGDSSLVMEDLTYYREDGTYYRKKALYWLDGVLIANQLKEDKELSLEVLNFPFLQDEKGAPFSFSRYAIEGISDHFPFLFKISVNNNKNG